MATYNGERYIEEQLQSIINQTYKDWTLLIRDDNSNDSTPMIIEKISKLDNRIIVLENQGKNLKQCQNFNELMRNAGSFDYYMFSDQDDVWLEDKILVSLESIKKHESNIGNQTPILVYSNYYDTNSNLDILKKAYSVDMSKLENIDRKILMQNWLMGCTMIFNSSTYKISKNIPMFAVNHDEWVASVVGLFGEIYYLDEVTLKHRIHNSNVTTREGTVSFHNRIRRLLQQFNNTKELNLRYLNYHKQLSKIGVENNFSSISLNLFEKLINSKGYSGVKIMYKHNFLHYTRIQTILYALQIYFHK